MKTKRLLKMGMAGLLCMSLPGLTACAGKYAEEGLIRPGTLTCEYMENPSTVDEMSPRLSWINEAVSDDVRGEYQQAYRICVASSEENLQKGMSDVWDSGKVRSSDSRLIAYGGKTLQSGKDYWWRVMVWDSRDRASGWSRPAYWGMGILSPGEWQARWIGAPWQGEESRRVVKPATGPEAPPPPHFPAPLFRKTFDVTKKVVSAKAFVTGLGYFELYVNGEKAGDDCLVPNFTNYTPREGIKYAPIAIDNRFRDYRVTYLAYDVGDMLRERRNVVGAIVGDGFYDCTSRWVASFGSPRFLCQVEILYEDGSRETVCSDETWKVKASPVVMNGVYDGEIYDANLETDGWATVRCDDAGWAQAVLREAPAGRLTAHTAPADKVVERLSPLSLSKRADGAYEADFGVEISGWIRFKDLQGRKGDTLDVKYVCESPLGVQKYVFKGDGKESYAPRFTWYVFRKAIISGIDRLEPEMLTAEAVNTDVKVSAEFRTSNELFNQINAIWRRSLLDNLHGGIMSDCPHRERSPYTGDGQAACVTVMHNFQASAFYRKWIRDIRDAQDVETGYVPNGAPWQPGCGGGVPWGAAMNIMPWEFYLHYGDPNELADNYHAMKEQVRYMLTWLTKDGTMHSRRAGLNATQPNYWLNLGDWAPAYGLPSEELVHTFYLWRCADLTARAAKALNRTDDSAAYAAIADRVRQAFNRKFYDSENETFGDFGSNIFALAMGLPPERRERVKKTLYREIVEKYDGHLNTGLFATQFFFETLAANGMNDVAYEAMNKRDFPSYGRWIEQGATTTWEQWDGRDSRNHPMFGGGLVWFYRALAGVNADENEPGYRHIIIKPLSPGKPDEVYYANQTPYGKLVSGIKQKDGRLEMCVTIPVGSHATIYIPAGENATVTESGNDIGQASGIELLGRKDGYCTVKAGQGVYRFEVAI
jgi:alpha-L-rhamnosidase